MSGGLELRPFVQADDDEVSSWFADAGELRFFAGPTLVWPPDTRQWDELRSDPEISAWTAVFGDDPTIPIGHGELVSESARVVRLARIAITPALRGEGLGREMCQGLLDKAREAGFQRIGLSVFPENASAIRAYRALGFVAVGDALNSRNIRMERDL
jgi:RimJ/RimL family protein N-acetyltransferase